MVRIMKVILIWSRFLVFGLAFLLVGCGGEKSADGLYVATTDDNVDLKMRRYRPTEKHGYSNGTPILLFPSIVLNINEFDVHTPSWAKNYRYRLPWGAPAWAKNDTTIKKDNLKYFSMAHYLYLRGYDVWMANYRGVGRDEFASEHGNSNTNLDVWCSLDYPAAVDKVRAVTNKKPVIGGHSTGGLCAYLYLQGITMDADVVAQGDYLPHVTASEELAIQRNENVAGYLGIDPAGTPILAYEWLLDSPFIFGILGSDVLLDLDEIMPTVMSLVHPDLLSGILNVAWGVIGTLADRFPDFLPHWADVFGALDFWSVDNMDKYVEDYTARIGVSSFYMGGFAQYADWGINGTYREHWQNGEENVDLVDPPASYQGDGYYNFQDNMAWITAPSFSVFSESDALVSTDVMVERLYGGKTYHSKDAWMEVPNTGHVDIVYGDQAPTVSFPAIADWLDELE